MQGERKPRCAIYCRVAYDDSPDPGFAIEQQRRKVLANAREMGYVCETEYLDDGYAGTTHNRPGLTKLNADIYAGEVKTVLMASPSRIWRDAGNGRAWFRRMDRLGVTVYCMDDRGMVGQDVLPEVAGLFKRGKKKHGRHTARTPPPNGKPRKKERVPLSESQV